MQTQLVTSRHNPLLQHVRRLLSSKSYRTEQREYVGDGLKLLEEAVRWNAEPVILIETEGAVPFPVPETVRRITVPEDVMRSVSPMKAPQGALFVCRMPPSESFSLCRRMLYLDGLQDAGNVGTILRTADAMDVPVILSDDCADPYNAKTVRASMGAIFRTPPMVMDRETLVRECKAQNIPLIVTALTANAKPISPEELNGICVIGSEGSGVDKMLLDAADREIIIPMNPRCESLNAASAASIVLWEMRKR